MRNIVLITLDSVRADHCSFMGYHRMTTPTLDRMAKRGLVFRNAIAAGVGTPSSMMGAFTGKFAPLAEKVNPILWRKEFQRRTTIAEKLSKLGYATGAFVPNAFASSYFGFNKGFQYFEDYLSNNKKLFEKIFESALIKNNRLSFIVRNLLNFALKREVFTPWTKYYEDIVSWVDRVDEPFFLWILVMDTHFPYLAPRKYRKWCNLLEMFHANWKLQSVNFEDKLSESDKDRLINAYDCSIRFADEFVKQLWKDLSSYDPVFIVHADHGDGFGEHGYYMHGFVRNTSICLYEELIHIPIIVYNLDNKGDIITNPFSLIDLPKLLMNLNLDGGVDIGNLCNSEYVVVRAVENKSLKLAIRSKDWKFIRCGDLCELYYLPDDLNEQKNLYNLEDDHIRLIINKFKKISDYLIQKYTFSNVEQASIKKSINNITKTLSGVL